MKKSLFKNTIYKSILSFVNIVVPLFVGPFVVRLLDVELYGTYNAVFAEFQVFLTFGSFGLYTFGIREISKIRDNKDKVSKLFTNLFVISILSNVIVCVIYLIYAFFTSSGLALLLYIIMTIQFVGNIFYIEFVNEAVENYKFITIKSVIIKILYLISIFLLLRKPTDVPLYAIIVSLVNFANNFVSFIYAKKYIKFDFSEIKIKKYIIPLATILIISDIGLLYSQLDKIMLGKFINGVAVSYYYIPYYIMGTLVSIPYSIINISIPRLSYQVANDSKENYEYSLNKIFSSLLFVIIPMCFGVLALANEVIFIYAGEKYIACVLPLVIACIMRIIISCESVYTNLVMYPNNQEKRILKISLICGVINLVLNSLVVVFKVFNPSTAMITTTIAELLIIIFQNRYVRDKLKIKLHIFSKQNVLYLFLSLLFIPITILVKLINFGFYLNILIIITISMLLYGGVLILVKDENIYIIINKFLGILKRNR